jgi:predicted nuclease of predicted toxin-antitoxin system
MKFLFDENISYRIVKKLKSILPDCIHVSQTPLRYASTDRNIWEYAKSRNYMIVTFDEDFKDLANLLSFPPKVVLLKTGNCSTGHVVNLLQNSLEEITAFSKSEIHGVMEIS